MHYGEIGEMADRPRGGQEVKNSLHYEEIGEMTVRAVGRGSGSEEFVAF